jgi:hypothetical protein
VPLAQVLIPAVFLVGAALIATLGLKGVSTEDPVAFRLTPVTTLTDKGQGVTAIGGFARWRVGAAGPHAANLAHPVAGNAYTAETMALARTPWEKTADASSNCTLGAAPLAGGGVHNSTPQGCYTQASGGAVAWMTGAWRDFGFGFEQSVLSESKAGEPYVGVILEQQSGSHYGTPPAGCLTAENPHCNYDNNEAGNRLIYYNTTATNAVPVLFALSAGEQLYRTLHPAVTATAAPLLFQPSVKPWPLAAGQVDVTDAIARQNSGFQLALLSLMAYSYSVAFCARFAVVERELNIRHIQQVGSS